MKSTTAQSIPRRRFRDDTELSVIGFGGIIVCGVPQKDANSLVSESFERGVNYYDVAPSYFDGEVETKLGPALEPFRNRSFLACKTERRDAKGARAELERSLGRLRTDHFDLYQFHAVTTKEDVNQILAPGGALETFVKAREEGLVRYLGFSAHSTEAALSLLYSFPFDSVLFPLNFVNVQNGNFGPQILARSQTAGVARLALKAMALTPWKEGEAHTWSKTWYKPAETAELRALALRYTLGQDITAAIPPGHIEIFREALETATDFTPLAPEEKAALIRAAEGLAPLFST
jgi:predicted aldo/keto reductase-like oxidoreductase